MASVREVGYGRGGEERNAGIVGSMVSEGVRKAPQNTVRSVSYSELATAMTCQARWDFGYGGRLTGGHTLKRRQISAILSRGRAWGAAVAAYHAGVPDLPVNAWGNRAAAAMAAHEALIRSYEADAQEQEERGVVVTADMLADEVIELAPILDHYIETTPRLGNLTRLEGEFNVPILSRGGRRRSNRYRFGGFLDGFYTDDEGNQWIVEFKLRQQLTPREMLQLSRQVRWYAWALGQMQDGQPPVGVLLDERLVRSPHPPLMKKNGKPSHKKDQYATPEEYVRACLEAGEDIHFDVEDNLRRREWGQQMWITFRSHEIEEAGEELVSAAKLIRDLDSGELYPIRNTQAQICRGCRFLKACPAPRDDLFLESIYEFGVPKRLRIPEEV